MKIVKRTLLYLLFLPILCTACSDDDYVYPNVLTEMVDLKTDATGKGSSLLTDAGIEWNIQPRAGLDELTPDSVYRIVTLYEPLTATDATSKEAKLYSIQQVIAPIPLPEAKFKKIKTDPVKLQSIWQSGKYLNLIVQNLRKDQLHSFHFIENKIVNENGVQTLYLTLYHDRKDDVEGYYQKVYLSVPLWAYKNILQKGDQIVFRLNTYQEGMISRTFTY